jgi:hypothetical protein
MKRIQVVLMVLLIFGPLQAVAAEGVVPFIKAEYYMKNITLEQFRVNPRSYFRSESAFDLLADFVGGEIGLPDLTNAEFIALLNDDSQVRTRSCSTEESINTGALQDDGFNWFERACRSGEEIVQIKFADVWVDVFSLNCLNAVEDKASAESPDLSGTQTSHEYHPSAQSCRKEWVDVEVTQASSNSNLGMFAGAFCNVVAVPGRIGSKKPTYNSRQVYKKVCR